MNKKLIPFIICGVVGWLAFIGAMIFLKIDANKNEEQVIAATEEQPAISATRRNRDYLTPEEVAFVAKEVMYNSGMSWTGTEELNGGIALKSFEYDVETGLSYLLQFEITQKEIGLYIVVDSTLLYYGVSAEFDYFINEMKGLEQVTLNYGVDIDYNLWLLCTENESLSMCWNNREGVYTIH